MGVRSSGLGRRVMGRTYRTKVSTGRPEIPKAGSSNKSYMSMVSTTLQAIEDEESPQYCPVLPRPRVTRQVHRSWNHKSRRRRIGCLIT